MPLERLEVYSGLFWRLRGRVVFPFLWLSQFGRDFGDSLLELFRDVAIALPLVHGTVELCGFTGSDNSRAEVGQGVAYSFVITNMGSTTLTAIDVTSSFKSQAPVRVESTCTLLPPVRGCTLGRPSVPNSGRNSVTFFKYATHV